MEYTVKPLQELRLFTLHTLIIDEVVQWCLDPRALLNLSSTSKHFARSLRESSVWLSHHQVRGYDTGVLKKKAERAASADPPQYGQDGWGVLVKSAFDKAEFPDDNHETQWTMGKPLPHRLTQGNDPDAIERYQDRGEKWMRVFYDILTEHECWNLKRFRYLHDEALQIRVKSQQGKYFQALISACDLLIGMWNVPVAIINTPTSYDLSRESLEEIPPHEEQRTCLESLTKAFLIAKKIMEVAPEAQTDRRLFPHRPFKASILEGPGNEIDSKGLGWIPKVTNDWKDRVYVVGQFTILCKNSPCPFNRMRLGPGVFRMCLDFHADGRVTGRGGDFGGRFHISSGSYRETFVSLVKEYESDDDGDNDIYHAQGHMTPWGVYGTWSRPQDSRRILGYWVMWQFEGATAVQIGGQFERENGAVMRFNQQSYNPSPGWFEEYEEQRDSGTFRERRHGYWGDPPLPLEEVSLPEMDAFEL